MLNFSDLIWSIVHLHGPLLQKDKELLEKIQHCFTRFLKDLKDLLLEPKYWGGGWPTFSVIAPGASSGETKMW